MQVKIINGEVFLVKDDKLFPPKTKGSELEIRYKIWLAHMNLYCTACAEPPFSTEIEEGKVYTISDKNLALV